MELNVSIDPDDINRMVSEAVLKSSIGIALNAAVAEEVKKFSATYDNPMRVAVRNQVNAMLTVIIQRDFAPVIEQHIKEYLTAEVVSKLCEGAFDALYRR